ncbi:MAG: DUF4278 domain-containing protein [Leptolyngbyaceae cyanobacterium bins.59]|nr:DUF4278 domain-containing protein [Leptolyngbyaceae cyanobacterium bins.59]
MFLISLAVCLIALYVATHSSDEICYLSGAISLVTLLVTIIISPWEVQVLLLVGSGFAIKRLSSSPQDLLESESGTLDSHSNASKPSAAHFHQEELPHEENKSPLFKYRGVSYDHQADHQASSHNEQASSSVQSPKSNPRLYRGVAYDLENSPDSVHLIPAPNSQLKYRGCNLPSQDSKKFT